jgi:hypothetical protein
MDIGALRLVGDYLCNVLAHMPRIWHLPLTVQHCLVTQPEPTFPVLGYVVESFQVSLSQCIMTQ